MEILQITGDKPEFSNFIGDTLILKEKSKVCLNKASFSIPVIVNRNVVLPSTSAGVPDYTKTFFNVVLNGLNVPITYQMFFDAYSDLSVLENPTIDVFYGGNYHIYLDNLCNFVSDGGDEYDIPNFSAIVAEACSTDFDYYQFDVQNKTEITNIGDYFQEINPPLVINGTNLVALKDNRRLTDFGITCLYAPKKMTNATASAVNWTAGVVNNFNTAGDRIESVDANPSMAACPNVFDPNGGYITAEPGVGAGKLSMGLIFMTKGHDDPLFVSGVYEPENFDVGIEWYLDGGNRTLRIIDGKKKFVYWDSSTNSEVETVKPNYMPPNKIYTWDHTVDKFWFIVRKGRAMNGTQEFVTTIIQGPGTNPEDLNNRVIYIASTTFKSSQIQIQTVAYSLGAANVLDNWEFIPTSEDSVQEDDYLDLGPLQDNREGIRTAQTFGIVPAIENTDWENERTFWESIGIIQTEQENNSLLTTEGNGYNKTLSWKVPNNGDRTYYFGTNQVIDTISRQNPNFINPSSNQNAILNFIPREISFSLMDMTINPRAGSFVRSNVPGNNGFFDSGTFNKVVNYIQTDKDDLDLTENQLINYNYEAYNLVYRKLENQQPVPITQLKAKLSFKDFEQNNEVQIKNIYGVGKFELLFDTD